MQKVVVLIISILLSSVHYTYGYDVVSSSLTIQTSKRDTLEPSIYKDVPYLRTPKEKRKDFVNGFFLAFFFQILAIFGLRKRNILGRVFGFLFGLGAWAGIGLFLLKATLESVLLWYGIVYAGILVLITLFFIVAVFAISRKVIDLK